MLRFGSKQLAQLKIQEDADYLSSLGTYLEERWVRDHLPFGLIINKIAMTVILSD